MMIVPWSLTCRVGRGYFRLVKKLPIAHIGVCAVGLAVGVIVLYESWPGAGGAGAPAAGGGNDWLALGLGGLIVLFYAGLAAHHILRRIQGRWDAWCERCASVFEQGPPTPTVLDTPRHAS